MAAQSPAALRRPNKPGFMAPFVLLETVSAIAEVVGDDALGTLLKDAQLFRLPEPTEPVREDKVARMHQSLRCLWPEESVEICQIAGEASADRIMERQITERAQGMLAKMPRATGAWLLAKAVRQNAWIFSGSGQFVVESESRFMLEDNPIVQGETSDTMVCHFHASLFEKMFSTLIHPGLICQETSCRARGDAACVFEFTLDASV